MQPSKRKDGPSRGRAILKFQTSKPPDWIQAKAERLERETHDLTCETWATWLCNHLPEEYPDPPTSPAATDALPGSEAKILIASERDSAGYLPRHPQDQQWEQADHLGRKLTVHRNGSIESDGLAMLGCEDEPEPEPEVGYVVVYRRRPPGCWHMDDPPFDFSRESAVRWAWLLGRRGDVREARAVTVEEAAELMKPEWLRRAA